MTAEDVYKRQLLSSYDFHGDEVPIIVGSALGALNGNAEDEQKIRDLMKACLLYTSRCV